jgi:hypothetical protein
VNDAGKQGVQLNADEYGGILGIYNKASEPHVGLSAFKTGGALVINNAAGTKRQAFLGADEDGGRLLILNKTGTQIVEQIP